MAYVSILFTIPDLIARAKSIHSLRNKAINKGSTYSNFVKDIHIKVHPWYDRTWIVGFQFCNTEFSPWKLSFRQTKQFEIWNYSMYVHFLCKEVISKLQPLTLVQLKVCTNCLLKSGPIFVCFKLLVTKIVPLIFMLMTK